MSRRRRWHGRRTIRRAVRRARARRSPSAWRRAQGRQSPSATPSAGARPRPAPTSSPWPAGKPVTVQRVTGGSAQAGVDYTLASDQVTVSPGQSTAAVTLNVLNTAQVGPNKTVVLTLASPSNAMLASKNITFTDTITETNPVVGFAQALSSRPETQSGSLQVVLNTATTTPVTVQYAAKG